MSRAADAVVPILAIVALLVTGLLFAPSGVKGADRALVVPAGQQRHDVIRFGEPVVVSGTVTGDVQVVGETATVSGHVLGDLVVLLGSVVFQPGAVVEGDVVCVGGRIENLEDARVGGAVFSPGSFTSGLRLAGLKVAGQSSSRGLSLLGIALKLSLLLVWLVAAIVVTLVSGREVRASSIELRVSSVYTFVLGLVVFTSFVLTAILFSYLVPYFIGIPLLVVLFAFALMTKVYGMIAVFHSVGTLLAGARNRQELDRRRWLRGDIAMVVIGLLVLGALRMIPVLGNVIWIVVSLLGVGVSVGTKFGRREPGFLAFRPVTES